MDISEQEKKYITLLLGTCTPEAIEAYREGVEKGNLIRPLSAASDEELI